MDSELVTAVHAMDNINAIPKQKLVVFIDTQVDFMIEGSALYVPGAQDIVGALNHFAYHLKPEETAGVLFTFDSHYVSTYDSMPESKQFPIHCVVDTPGWNNVINENVINQEIPVATLRKGVFNMWEEDDVQIYDAGYGPRDAYIDQFKADGIDTVVIVGVAADFCVHWAVNGFVERGFNVEIPRALTAGIIRDIDTVVAEEYAGKPVKVV